MNLAMPSPTITKTAEIDIGKDDPELQHALKEVGKSFIVIS